MEWETIHPTDKDLPEMEILEIKLIRCHLCTKWHPREATDFGYCEHWGRYTMHEDFCSYGATTT